MSGHAPFLGVGWSFPPAFDRATGSVITVAGPADVAESLLLILTTSPGERPLLPGFGCALRQFVFESVDQGMLTGLASEMRTAIERYEPRVGAVEVTAEEDATDPGLLRVTVTYTIRSTNSRYNLVVPFCLTEGTATGIKI